MITKKHVVAKNWTWDAIKNRNWSERYPRSFTNEWEYNYHKDLVKEFFKDVEEYIRISCIDIFEPWILIKNKYPYRVDPNIKHYLLWIKPGVSLTHEQVLHIVSHRFPNYDKKNIIAYQNEMHKRSIVTLSHYQIFLNF